MSSSDIKVMVIDDSVLIRKYVSKIIDEIPGMQLIATAPNGKIGVQKIYLYKPDVVILDIEMPEMSGIDVLKYLKENSVPTVRPQVIILSSIVGNGSRATFEALENGAVDFIKKPDGKISENIGFLKKELELKINGLKEAEEDSRNNNKPNAKDNLSAAEREAIIKHNVYYGIADLCNLLPKKSIVPKIIAVASSTGGPHSIRKVLDKLNEIPVPMMIAQHMPIGFTFEFANNLSQIYERDIVEAQDGETLKNGTIYICPGGIHSRIKKVGLDLVYQADKNEYDAFFYKPSTDIFFKSIMQAVGKDMLGIVLSGMGKDGSIESPGLRQAGALMIAQDKPSSVVWGMPGSSVKKGGIDIIIDIYDMGEVINKIIKKYLK